MKRLRLLSFLLAAVYWVLAGGAAWTAEVSPAATAPPKAIGAFLVLDPAQVHLGGEMGRRIELTIQKNLLLLDVEHDFLEAFRQKQVAKDGYVGLGKLLDSAVSFAHNTQDPQVIAWKDRYIHELLATQLDDGYLGTFPPDKRIRIAWDLHEMAYNIQALVNNDRWFHDLPSREAARKMGDYILQHCKGSELPRDIKLNIERAMLALSEALGDPQYRDYVVEGTDLRHWTAPVEGHAYTIMNLCLAQVDLYRQQPDASLLVATQQVIDRLTQNDGLMITGTCSLKEGFHYNQQTRGDLGESCATAYLIRLAHHQLQLEGKSLDGDLIERAVYNALFAAQSPDGRQLRYFTAIDGPRKYWDKDTYCCPGNWRRIVAELPEMVYYRSADGGVLVNLYTASTADVPLADGLAVRLRQETDYPNSGTVTLTVEPSRPAEFSLALRIPRWCTSAAVAVNGQPAGDPANPGEWFSLRRSWKSGDVVTLQMPMQPRLVRGRKLQAGKVAVTRGPVVYCFSPVRNAHQHPVYAGRGEKPADIQQSIEEAIAQTRFDWTTLGEPIPDATVRPDGMALEVRAWGPESDRSQPADLTLVLTEYIDPTGQATYLPSDDPTAGVEDELCGTTVAP